MNPFEIWGDGKQVRDFIYVDDVVEGLLKVVEKNPTATQYNVATGKGTTITELVQTITDIYGYVPEFKYALDKPTMIPIRLVDVSKIKRDLSWVAKYDLRTGLEKTIHWYQNIK